MTVWTFFQEKCPYTKILHGNSRQLTDLLASSFRYVRLRSLVFVGALIRRQANKTQSPLPFLEAGSRFAQVIFGKVTEHKPAYRSQCKRHLLRETTLMTPLKMTTPPPPACLFYRPCFILLCSVLLHVCLCSNCVHVCACVCAFSLLVSPAARTVPGTWWHLMFIEKNEL